MGARPLIGMLIAIGLVACTPTQIAVGDGPVLVQEYTLLPNTPALTRELSSTPTDLIVSTSTISKSTEISSFTPQSGFVLITPTLPPSKTPTRTPTVTSTPLPSLTATLRPTFSANMVLATPGTNQLPNGIVPIPTAMVVNATPQSCTSTWFFVTPIVASCPLNPPLVSEGSFQPFQRGMMIWVAQQDAIYVLFNNNEPPRWQVYNDAYQDGMLETDPSLDNPPSSTWQPKRGFGLLWRNHADIQTLIGWAVTEAEIPFTTQVQISGGGVIFISEPNAGIYSLDPDGTDWRYYSRQS